jgi:hypothetical protein
MFAWEVDRGCPILGHLHLMDEEATSGSLGLDLKILIQNHMVSFDHCLNGEKIKIARDKSPRI